MRKKVIGLIGILVVFLPMLWSVDISAQTDDSLQKFLDRGTLHCRNISR